MWDRWVEGNGDIAVATTWERKVKPGVTAKDVEEILKLVAVERNMRDVGVLPLSKELEARSGKKEKLLTVYSYCSPATARKMVDFSPHMAAYLPCRISVVEHDPGGNAKPSPSPGLREREMHLGRQHVGEAVERQRSLV